MALQDLTPQLRTRLSRMERAVGWFVIIATGLLLFGFGYYIYNTGARRGWFVTKISYQTSISSGAGLKEGDPVKLMGFDVGEITDIIPNEPTAYYNITVNFRIKKPHYGYIWTDSKVRVVSGNLLGNRYLEIREGESGLPTVLENQEKVATGLLNQAHYQRRRSELGRQFQDPAELTIALKRDVEANTRLYYTNLDAKPYWIEPEESPAITERLERLVDQVEEALPNILRLTNQLAIVLSNSTALTANLNDVVLAARPAVDNIAAATAQLDRPGGLGEWLFPTNINQKLDSTLTSADTNLVLLAHSLNLSLENLAAITSNLNSQVQANTNILSNISETVVNADSLIQGLKRHWLLRSAFKEERTNAPTRRRSAPLRSPSDER